MNWQRPVARILNWVEQKFDRLRYGRNDGSDPKSKLVITPYLGFGSSRFIYIKGRLLRDKEIWPAREGDTLLDNLVNTYRRFQSDEIPGGRLRVSFQGAQFETCTDEEGFFEAYLDLLAPLLPEPAWQPVDLELLEPSFSSEVHVRARGMVLSVSSQAQFGVISDIDDTILVTHATNPLRMGLTIVFKNARARQGFPGVPLFYQTLQRGTLGAPSNPLFYVSSSPWNLYDLLVEFLQVQDIPLGPMVSLRDWGITQGEFLPTRHYQHKLGAIRLILDWLPNLPFILIGDSGQEDAKIYREVVRGYPGRILGVYIRNISRSQKRIEWLNRVGEEIEADGSTFLLTTDTQEMAQHAREQGWIV